MPADLHQQIALIQPKLIVALGKTASAALLAGYTLRGKLHDYNGIPLVATYHLAYLLRSPSEKAKARQDLRLATEALQKMLSGHGAPLLLPAMRSCTRTCDANLQKTRGC